MKICRFDDRLRKSATIFELVNNICNVLRTSPDLLPPFFRNADPGLAVQVQRWLVACVWTRVWTHCSCRVNMCCAATSVLLGKALVTFSPCPIL